MTSITRVFVGILLLGSLLAMPTAVQAVKVPDALCAPTVLAAQAAIMPVGVLGDLDKVVDLALPTIEVPQPPTKDLVNDIKGRIDGIEVPPIEYPQPPTKDLVNDVMDLVEDNEVPPTDGECDPHGDGSCDAQNDPTCCENHPSTPGCSCYSHDPPPGCGYCDWQTNPHADPEACLQQRCYEDPNQPLCTGERVICSDGSRTDWDTDGDGTCNYEDSDDDGDGVPDGEDPSPWANNPVDNAYSCVVWAQQNPNNLLRCSPA